MRIGNLLYGMNGMARTGRPKKAKDEKFDRVTLTLPPDLLKRAKELATGKVGGLSGLVARALTQILAESGERRKSKRGD